MTDCQHYWDQAVTFLHTKAATLDPDALRLAVRSPAAHEAIGAIDAAMRASDAEACAVACRAYCRVILDTVKAHTPQEVPYA